MIDILLKKALYWLLHQTLKDYPIITVPFVILHTDYMGSKVTYKKLTTISPNKGNFSQNPFVKKKTKIILTLYFRSTTIVD